MNAVSRVGKGEPVALAPDENPLTPPEALASAPAVSPGAAPGVSSPVVPAPAVSEPAAAALAEPLPARRKSHWLRWLLMIAVPLALAVGGGYYWIIGGRFQETDNANLRQPHISIASEEAGRVTQANVVENGQVHAGDVLFVIDPQSFRIALDQANAALAGARVGVAQLRASYSQAQAQEQIAAQNATYLQGELDRQTELSKKGIATRTALDQAQRDLANAKAQQEAAKQGIASALAALGGDADIPTDRHPSVLSALAARDKAVFDLDQTTVRAPAEGVISQATSFKVGQYVTPGVALFALVETGDSWIEANFKETQLTHLRVGQAADIVLDTYPGLPLHATVETIGAGTGAEFSLLPAQNATGNWVKVTQRIPVRLRISDAHRPPLRTGMSASVSVDTGASRGMPTWLGGRALAAE